MAGNAVLAELARAILARDLEARASEHRATVSRVGQDGTYWVSIPGGTDETPINTALVEAEPGDSVVVRISNGKATMTGNATSPTATGKSVSAVRIVAETASDSALQAALAANSALDDATIAKEATAQVVELLDGVQEMSEQAGKTVAQILQDGEDAGANAEQAARDAASAAADAASAAADAADAIESASTAAGAANLALNNLAVTQDVVDAMGADLDDLQTHVAMTNQGLHVVPMQNGYSVLLSTTSMKVLDPLGDVVAEYGEGFRVGRLSGTHMVATGDKLSFVSGDGVEVAYIEVDTETNESMFHITRAVVMKDLRFGDWKWADRSNGNLALKWIGGNTQ